MSNKEKRVIEYCKYQQGDVVMFRVDDETFKENTKDTVENTIHYDGHTHTHAILAFGEATGHKHQVNMADMVKEAGVTLHMGTYQTAGEDTADGF